MDNFYKLKSPTHSYLKSYLNNTNTTENTNKNLNYLNYRNITDRQTFQISNKPITKDEWDSIIKLLETNKNFETLSIIGINIESYGLKKLTDIIYSNNCIKTFKLEWNYLNDYPEEFLILFHALSKNCNIHYLHLNNNKLNSAQAEMIANAIESNSNILQLDLRWNEITNDGGRKLLDALNKNYTLQEMNLTGNKISDELILELNERLYRNKMIFNKSNDKNCFLSKGISESNQDSNRSAWKASRMTHADKSNLNFSIDDYKNKNLNKDLELLSEYKARYESQLLSNSNLEAKLKETELILNNERSRFEDHIKQIEKEIQSEKEMRKEYEQQFLKKNEEFIKKESDLKKIITENEAIISALNLKKEDLCNENILINEKLKSIKDSCEEKYRLLETQFNDNNKFHEGCLNNLKSEYEKLKKDDLYEIKRMNTEWNRKYKSLEEENYVLKQEKEELEKINFNLKKEFNEKKIYLEFENKERETKTSEENNRKIENLIKNYESKFNSINNSNQELKEKISNLNKEVTDLRKSHTDEKIKLERTIDSLSLEKSRVIKNENTLNLNVNSLDSEILLKDEQIDKLKKELKDLNNHIKNNESKNSMTIEELSIEYTNDRHSWKKERQDLLTHNKNLENMNFELEKQLHKLESTKQKFLENLKKEMSIKIDERPKHTYL